MHLSYKQFIISNETISNQKMVESHLDNGLYLYTGEDLHVRKGLTEEGIPFCLLGEAFCMDHYPKDVIEDLRLTKGKDIFTITASWTGRWVLILDSVMITDACGLMSVYYCIESDQWLVSSSLALLSNQLGFALEKRVSRSGINWRILPQSLQGKIKSLFCTQMIVLGDTLEFFFHNRFASAKELPYEVRLSTVVDCLVTGIKNIAELSGKRIWLALTAGKDSRLVFAASVVSGIPFETFTAQHSRMIMADRSIPRLLSKKYNKNHHLLRKNRFSSSKYEEYCVFSGYNSLGADAEFYATGQFDQIPANTIILRSGLFEAGQNYARRIAGEDKDSFIQGICSYYKESFKDPAQLAAFNEWLDYQGRNPMPGIDIRDRFYLEQRLNGWAAAIEQSLDIIPTVSLQIANSAKVLGCLLYASAEDRKGLKLSYDLVRRLDDQLLEYPVNKITWLDTLRFAVRGMKRRLHL